MSILDLIGKLVDAVIKFFEFKITNSKKDNELTKKEKKKEKELNKKIDDVRNAIHSNNDDKLNSLLSKCLLIGLLSLSCIFSGCVNEKVVYVTQDRQIKSITYEGVEGKFVPNSVMEEIVTDALKWRNYQESLMEKVK